MDKYEQHELLGKSTVYRAMRVSDGGSVALRRVRGWGALEAAEQVEALREFA